MKIGLALGGGATRGMAHVGILSVLMDAGIQIHCVAGCSAGSVVGAVFCAGMPIDQMINAASHLRWNRLASRVMSRRGLITFDRLERWLVMVIGDLYFAELTIPFAAIAADTLTGERVVLQEGRVARAVRASCSLPGIAVPVEINDRILMDGGIVDNLPVSAARELGADFVIGSDIFEPDYRRGPGLISGGLVAIETLIRHAGGGVGLADYLISPRTAGNSFISFRANQELILLGKKAALESLPGLLAAIKAYH